jgi:hypothetical protein
MLEKNFKGMGFTFEQTGVGGDYIKVIPNNGNEPQTFSFNNVGNATRKAFSSPTGMGIGNSNSKELEKNADQAVKLQSYLRLNASTENEDDLSAVNRIKNNTSRGKAAYVDPNNFIENNKYYESEDYKNAFKELTFQQKKNEIREREREPVNLSIADGDGWLMESINEYVFGDTPNAKARKERLLKAKQTLYKSEEYKVFLSEKQKYDAQKEEKYDKLYDELVIAKQSGNKEAIKTVKAKIEGGYSKDLIGDNLNNMTGHQYDLKHSMNDFNKRKEKLELDAKNKTITQEQYNDGVESLSSEAQRLYVAAKNVAATQKRMNALAGIYVAEKAKSGGFFGNLTNALVVSMDEVREPLSYIFPLIGKDLSGDEARKISLDSKIITPQQRQYYKDKGYNDEQIKNVLLNNVQKNAIAANKRAIIETFGSDLTTEESKQNLSFFEQALVGVAASLPSMLTRAIPIVGQVAAFASMANMSYNAINEEMLNDTDFETTSEAERAVVAVPYALVMGALENIGLRYMTSGKSTLLAKAVLSTVAKAIPFKAGREVAEKVINKEVKSLISKGAIKIVNGTLVEGETGFYQAALLDYGLKALYNELDPLDLKLTNKEGLTGGELFETPDTKMGVAGAILEGAAAEAIGGFAMSTVMTGAQGLINGKISLYNEEDLKFFEDFSSDQEFKKLIVSNLKTEMLNGTMTKGEAQSALNDIDLVEGVFNSIDENISDEAKIIAFNLINERNRLEKEVIGKDPALSKEKNDRIKDINDKLGTLPLQVLYTNNIERATELETALKQRNNKAGTVTIDGKKLPRVEAETELNKINQKIEDAVQKQAAGEVPVQPTTEVGEEVVQGEPTAEPQGLTEEGKAEEVKSSIESVKRGLERDILRFDELLKDESISEEDRSYYEEEINLSKQELELFNSNPIEYAKSKLEIFSEKDEKGELEYPSSYDFYKGMYDALTAEQTTEGKAEEVAPQTLLEELQLLAGEQDKAPKAPAVEAPKLEAPVIEAKAETNVVQEHQPRKPGYKNSIVKKEESATESGVAEYKTYAVDENGNERLMSSGGIRTTVGELAAASQNSSLFYAEDENGDLTILKLDPNTEVLIQRTSEGNDSRGNYEQRTSVRLIDGVFEHGAFSSDFLTTKDIFSTPIYKTNTTTTKATKTKGELPKMRWDDIEEYDDAVIRAMKEIQYRKLNPLRDLGKRTTVAQKEEIKTIEAKIATAERILDRRANKIKKEAQRVEKEGKGATVRAVDNNGTEAEYSVVVSKDGATAKVQLKKIGTLTPKRASVEANLEIKTDEKRGRFVITKNKTKVYIDDVITPAKVETTKAKATTKAKVEVAPVKEEVKEEAKVEPVAEEVKAEAVKEEVKVPAPAKESTDDLMGAIDSIKEDIEETTEEIEKARAEARKKINKIREEIIDLKESKGKEGTIMDLEADIKEIEDILKGDLDGLKLDLDRHVQALKEEVKKLEDLDAKAPENKKTLLSYLDAAIATLNGLNKLTYAGIGVGTSMAILKKILQGIRAGVIAGNNISASIKAMASQYRGEHKNEKITIAEFTEEIKEYLRNTFVDQKTNEQDIQEARDKFVEIREAVRKAKLAVKTESQESRKKAFDAIREMLKGKVNNLSAVQLNSIMLRLASFNALSQTQYDKFIDYVDKVIGIADYDKRVNEANKNRKTAKKNLPKLGDISSDLLDPLSRVLNINAKLIPSEVFESYSEIVEMLSKRDAILELNKRADLNESLDKIIESIELNEQRVSDLKELYDSFAGKVVENNVVNYAKTLDEMLKDGIIDKSEYDLMKTFKSKIQAAKVKEKMTEQEIADEKVELINEINNTTITLDEIVGDEFRLERDLVKKLQTFLKNKELLESLNNKNLKDLLRVIDNINNGFVSNSTQEMVEKLNSIEKSILLESSIPETFKSIVKTIKEQFNSSSNAVNNKIRVAPLFNIDQQLGDFKTKNVFNSVFNESAKAQQAYQSAITLIQDELSNIEREISNSKTSIGINIKKDRNSVRLSRFKMMVYMMQLEYDSNPNNNQVHQAMDTLNKTIEVAKKNRGKSGYSLEDIKLMESIKEQFAKNGQEFEKDGETKKKIIDIDKLYNSFNEAEKNGLKKLQEINNRMTKFATYTATVINGNKIKPFKNYISYTTINESDILSSIDTTNQINDMNANMQPGTKSKNLEERDENVHAVVLDPFYATNSSSRSVLLNYHMTEAVRTARKTLKNADTLLSEKESKTQDQVDILAAITDAYNEATKDLLESNFNNSNEWLQFFKRQGYRAMLASGTRASAELLSNYAFVGTNNPLDFKRGKSKEINKIKGADKKSIMTILQSKVSSRLFPTSSMNSIFVDAENNANRSAEGNKAKTKIINGVTYVFDNTTGRWVDRVAAVADYLISKPDQLVMRPLWFGAFSRTFEKEAGVKPDFDKIMENNEEYMDKYKDALEKATTMADKQVTSAGSSMNAYMGILKNVVRKDDAGLTVAAKEFNRFMNKFTVQEYYTAREGVRALVGNGTISRTEGAQVLAAVTLRMTIYSVFTKLFADGMLSVARSLGFGGDDDDKDDKTLKQKISQGLLSTATTLVFGRYFGNFIRVLENALIESVNEEYGDDIGLRDGEYDPYKDAIQFNQLQGDKMESFQVTDFVKVISGPYGPLLGVGDLAIKLLGPEPKEDRAKLTRKKELYTRLPFEIAGNVGLIPMYKDFRKIVMEGVYKELKEEKKLEAEEKVKKDKKTALTNRQKISSLRKMRSIGGYTDKEINKAIRIIKDPEYKKAFNDKEAAIEKKILDKYGYENLTDFKRNDKDNYEIEFGDDSPYRIERAESAKIANELRNRMYAIKDGVEYVPEKKKSKSKSKSKRKSWDGITRTNLGSSYSGNREYTGNSYTGNSYTD